MIGKIARDAPYRRIDMRTFCRSRTMPGSSPFPPHCGVFACLPAMRPWLVAAVVAAPVLAGCASTSGTTTTSTVRSTASRTTASTPAKHTTIAAPRAVTAAVEAERGLEREERAKGEQVAPYAGIGATKEAFKSHNDVIEGEPPREPPAGSDEDEIQSVDAAGRVTKYMRTYHFDPPPSNKERLSLLAGIGLPG